MKWEQSNIDSRVNPKFRAGGEKVSKSKSSSAYTLVSNIEFPERFTGVEAFNSTIKALDLCATAAYALPGMLSCIGRGMSIKDNASYAKLLARFDSVHQEFKKNKEKALKYQKCKYNPKDTERLQWLLTHQHNNGYGYGWGYLDEEARKNANIDFDKLKYTYSQAMKTGGKFLLDAWKAPSAFVGGCIDGGLSYFEDLATGAAGTLGYAWGFWGAIKDQTPFNTDWNAANLAGAKTAAKWASNTSNVCSLSDKYEAFLKNKMGINTDGVMYNAGRIVGNVATSTAVMTILPGGAAAPVALSGVTSYGVTLAKNVKANGGYKNMSDEEIIAANKHATKNAIISGTTALLTAGVNKKFFKIETGGDIISKYRY